MQVDKELLEHPYLAATRPERLELVRVSSPLPPSLNPFYNDKVVIRAAAIPGAVPHSKWVMGREAIVDGIKKGLITRETKVIEATSGNTGHVLAMTCNAIGIKFMSITPGDVPEAKVSAIRVFGTEIDLHFSKDESTVEKARRLGKEPGCYNPDQYAGSWNPRAQKKYLGPQLWKQAKKISVLATASGSMGTALGCALYAEDHDLRTRIVPVMCALNQEIPGARSRKRIERDVLQPWKEHIPQDNVEEGPRHGSFLLSNLSWSYVPQMLGPSFGLGLYGAISFIARCKLGGELDALREADGTVQVVVIGADDNRLYGQLYLSELRFEELASQSNLKKVFADRPDILSAAKLD